MPPEVEAESPCSGLGVPFTGRCAEAFNLAPRVTFPLGLPTNLCGPSSGDASCRATIKCAGRCSGRVAPTHAIEKTFLNHHALVPLSRLVMPPGKERSPDSI